MLDFSFNIPSGRPPRLMFIGAHCDDIEIGCGGTVIELLRRYPDAHVHWVVLSSEGVRKQEARAAANAMLRGVKDKIVTIKDFRGAYFPSEAPLIKDCFEEIKRDSAPDIIFAHNRNDLHQDHRIVGELAWNTFRNHVIFEYEIPKYDGDMGVPTVFMPVSQAAMKRKIALLMRVFKTQHNKQWFTPDTFQGLMRLRGIECNSPSGYAEAFYSRKLMLGGAA